LPLETVGESSSQPVVYSLFVLCCGRRTDMVEQASSTRSQASREQRQLRSTTSCAPRQGKRGT
jgi:hypothetical protein